MTESACQMPIPADLAAPAEGRMIAVNGAEIYFEVCGQGEPLLLLHGYNGTGRSHWEGYRAELARHFRLIIPDLRGHGRSLSPPEAFTHRQAALDMCALLDFLRIGSIRAMGFSTGGMTLFHMATQQPARVEAMVPIVSAIYFPQSGRGLPAYLHQVFLDTVLPFLRGDWVQE